MSSENLSDIYQLFASGVPVGALLSGIVWSVGFAVEFLIKLFKSA